MTQLEAAREGKITREMVLIAQEEGLLAEEVLAGVARGTIVIPYNKFRKTIKPVGVGQGLTTKVSASIGTAKNSNDLALELEKLEVALSVGSHTIMDLSLGGDLNLARREVLKKSSVPVGSLPLYQVFVEAFDGEGVLDFDIDRMFEIIEKQAQDGVDFMAFHCAMTLETLERMKKQGRTTNLVSWGGSLLAGWMAHHGRENPLYEHYDRLLEICRKYDVTLSLADGLRPGSLADSLDRGQVQEMVILGELVDRAREAGVQIMIKGPGHVPLNQAATTVKLMKQLCKGAPYFVFGFLSTDVAPGYDHITAAIGGAIAAMAGADFLCYVTPAEHVRFPTLEDVREGVMASRIAAHSADIAKGVKGAWEWDKAMAKARSPWNWEKQLPLAMDPEKLWAMGVTTGDDGKEKCHRCGNKCAMLALSKYLGRDCGEC